MINKLRDFLDTDVSMVILMNNIEELTVLTKVITSIGLKRIKYEVYKDDITTYMMELRMPYNRYLAMMRGLRKNGWTLRPETLVDIFNRMIKL